MARKPLGISSEKTLRVQIQVILTSRGGKTTSVTYFKVTSARHCLEHRRFMGGKLIVTYPLGRWYTNTCEFSDKNRYLRMLELFTERELVKYASSPALKHPQVASKHGVNRT